ncbi:carbohydrate ABC transporter permease [Microbispora sp. CA-102843]|uniref:carbohydrate ABC transporter permease n=1 Tax=Microbispora sp. CA-102843 TaxID=3239952 RepID=UPI003D916789
MTTTTHTAPPVRQGSTPTRAGRPGRWGRPEEWGVGLCLIAPAVILFCLFSAYPFGRTVLLSFTDWSGLTPTFNWIGLRNYLTAFSDGVWWESVGHSLILAVLALTVMNGISLGLALALDRKIGAQLFYRTVFYLPPVLSGIVVAIIWKWIFQPYGGPLNQLVGAFGLGGHAWLGDESTALLAVSVASMWQGVGMPFLLFLAALQAIPTELYEAARVDGAGGWRIFRRITLPLMKPTLGVVGIMTLLGAMEMFNLVMAMTGGGPGYSTEVPVLHIYRAAFEHSQFGYASALSLVFCVLMLVVASLGLRFTRRKAGE